MDAKTYYERKVRPFMADDSKEFEQMTGAEREEIAALCASDTVTPISDAAEKRDANTAYACDCGSVEWNLRKDMKIECAGCGEVLAVATWALT